ncbi:scopoletin glucosyltransferase-like [Abrus precatorius]|uniref:Glycosyltransferase n=1 Tax=Abrus precatorius TaxID=3816 RepID=A0A8B8KY69_ABRPR|nr:scopoletin glucosyltransferase-like [Abrus precatorius]
MSSEVQTLHVFFFPFLAHGHMIPTVDTAKLFVEKGAKATIITTPFNASLISKTIGKAKTSSNMIRVQTIDFPSAEAGLPNGCENSDSITSGDLFPAFFKACGLLQKPLEKLLLEQHPHCVVADVLFPWAIDSAAKFGIPTLMFDTGSFFSLCVSECMRVYKPYKNVSSDSEPFVIPNLPGEIKMTRMQVSPDVMSDESHSVTTLLEEVEGSKLRSYGVVVNSFYELEKAYVDHFRKVLGRKAWHIGSVSLCNRDTEEKTHRGMEVSSDAHECLKWLDKKKANSVIYVCFGTITKFPNSQLKDIAMGLEASGQQFIWVVRKSKEDGEQGAKWLPDGFERRMEGKGLIITGWAPQMLILEHEAIGAFVTHCGWNSILEGVTAGVPMVTWPIAFEQFFNEKLVTEVLKIGIPVGVKKWVAIVGDSIKWDAMEEVVKRIMIGEEANEMRSKAKVLSQLAKQAVEEGGSSYSDLNALIAELGSLTRSNE